MDGDPKPKHAGLVLVERLTERLARLCRATELGPEASARAERVFRELIVPASRVTAAVEEPASPWLSEISDDNTPIEFSVTVSPEGSEVRVLFEPQGEEPNVQSHRLAALAMHEVLAREYGADLARFSRLVDLFVPSDMLGPFALWSAVVFSRGRAPAFKAYFNPHARGPAQAAALIQEGLERLGMPRALATLWPTLARRGPHRDEFKYFALDLNADPRARVKVYVRHHDPTAGDLELGATAAPGARPGEALEFARAMAGTSAELKSRGTFSCAAFVEGRGERPAAVTQYVPVCAYAANDAVVEERVSDYLTAHGFDSAPYRNVLHAFANRSLDAGAGMQSWVAFRRSEGVPRLTVYLASEARHVCAPGTVPAATSEHMTFPALPELLATAARYDLRQHPRIVAAARALDPRPIVLLLAILEKAARNALAASDAPPSRAALADLHAQLDSLLEREQTPHATLDDPHAAVVTALVREFRSPSDAAREAALAVASRAADDLGRLLRTFPSQLGAVESVPPGASVSPRASSSPVWTPAERDAATRSAFETHAALWCALLPPAER
ncbi:MAG TPA: tryptophan dimethylallyltransferase family protein [Polyangiaceae bacterium]|nr:tryptophan dimethylallyltransferase family protein [Polyangiaceae bacterium]